MKIGIGITTTPNRDYLGFTLTQWQKYLPKNARLIIHEDSDFRGVSVSKNSLLEKLDDCDHIFLADDDTYPIADDWWKPYVKSNQPHLQYNFAKAPAHWDIHEIGRYYGHVAYDKSRGCVLYIERRVLDIVGGMHNVFGKHGREHEDWSVRIHNAGLTEYPFQDIDTTNFHCMDQDQTGISSVEFSENQRWRYIDTVKLPLYAEYRSTGVPVIVARRNDNGHRDRLWRFLKQYYWHLPIYEGYHKDGPFNRSLGLNIAATMAGNWDVGVFIDSDAYIAPKQLEEAVELARRTQKVVSPFTTVAELNQPATMQVLESGEPLFSPADGQLEKIRTERLQTQSLVLVVPRNIFEQIGGFDEKFVGWGGEDNAFWHAATVVGGEVLRLDGSVYHMWHQPASRQYQPKNNQRWQRYLRAKTREDLWRVRNT